MLGIKADLKLGSGDGIARGPAVHAVVVRAGLDDLDLACDWGILPLQLGRIVTLRERLCKSILHTPHIKR